MARRGRSAELGVFSTPTMAWKISMRDMRPPPETRKLRCTGYVSYDTNEITVCAAQNNLQVVSTIAHELSHAIIHDSPAFDPNREATGPEEKCVTICETVVRHLVAQGVLVPRWRDRELDAARRTVLGAAARPFELDGRLSSESSQTPTSEAPTADAEPSKPTSRKRTARARA